MIDSAPAKAKTLINPRPVPQIKYSVSRLGMEVTERFFLQYSQLYYELHELLAWIQGFSCLGSFCSTLVGRSCGFSPMNAAAPIAITVKACAATLPRINICERFLSPL